MTRLAEHPDRCFTDRKPGTGNLDALGITTAQPVMIATEGAPWGSVKAHGLLANQFKIGSHACAAFMPSGWSTNSMPPRMTTGRPGPLSASLLMAALC
jgi:hypothetical protein